MPHDSRLTKKLEAEQFGQYAEEMAAREYIKRGYTILERNWRMGKIEIDIIAQKDDTLVVSEVKARKNTDEEAISAVNFDKRRRMVRAADTYLRKCTGVVNYRFDIVACVGTIQNFQMEIYEDAFLATDLF